MRGKTAKRLRAIARSLALPERGKYVPGGPLRHRAGFRHPSTGEWQEGAPIPRPAVMTECFRRAYKEAKQVYMGRPASTLRMAKVDEQKPSQDFRAALVESINAFYGEK